MMWTTLAVAVGGAALGGAVAGLVSRRALACVRPPVWLSRGSCELGTAVLCALVTAALGSHDASIPDMALPLVTATLAVPLTLSDLRCRRLPDVLTLPAYVLVGVAVVVVACSGADVAVVIRAVVSAMLLGGLHAGLRLLTPSAMGAGDVKLAGSVGGVLGASGWAALPVAAVIAAAVTLLLVVVETCRGRRGLRGHGVAYGPGLLTGALLVTVLSGMG